MAAFLLTTSTGWARTITVVSYNVQNLFDATDDGGEYRQFTRAGGWTSACGWTPLLVEIRTRLLGPIFAAPSDSPSPRSDHPSTVEAALRSVDRARDDLCRSLGLTAA